MIEIHLPVTAKLGIGTLVLVFVSSLLFFSIGCYLIATSFDDIYPDAFQVILGFGILIGSLFISSFLFRGKNLVLYQNRIEVRNAFGRLMRSIVRSEVKGFYEVELKNKGDNWMVCTILLDDGHIKLSENHYDGYALFMEVLRTHWHLQESVSLKTKWQYKADQKAAFSYLLMGLLLLGIFIPSLFSPKTVEVSSLIEFKGTVAQRIVLERRNKGGDILNITLREYPKFVFMLDGRAQAVTDVGNLVGSVLIGDTLILMVPRDQYQKKLSQELPLSFQDKWVGFRKIEVFGLRNKRQPFLEPVDYNNRNSDSPVVYFFLLIPVLLIVLGVNKLLKFAHM